MDFGTQLRVSGDVAKSHDIDPETEELVNRLLTRVGMMMEDACTCALVKTPRNGSMVERVNRVSKDVERMASLCVAAKALLGS